MTAVKRKPISVEDAERRMERPARPTAAAVPTAATVPESGPEIRKVPEGRLAEIRACLGRGADLRRSLGEATEQIFKIQKVQEGICRELDALAGEMGRQERFAFLDAGCDLGKAWVLVEEAGVYVERIPGLAPEEHAKLVRSIPTEE